MSCVQLSERGFRVVYPLGLWSRSPGVVNRLFGYGWQTVYTCYYYVSFVGGAQHH